MYTRIVDDWEVYSLLNGYNTSKILKFNKMSAVTGNGYTLKIVNDNDGLIELTNIVKKMVLPELSGIEFGTNIRIKDINKSCIQYIELFDISKLKDIESIDYLGAFEIGSLSEKGCSIKLNENIKELHSKAFMKARIESINIKDLKRLERIGDFVFSEVTSIERFELGESIRELGYGVFAGSSLKELIIHGDMEFDWNTLAGARNLELLDIRECKIKKMNDKDKLILDKLVKLEKIAVNNEDIIKEWRERKCLSRMMCL